MPGFVGSAMSKPSAETNHRARRAKSPGEIDAKRGPERKYFPGPTAKRSDGTSAGPGPGLGRKEASGTTFACPDASHLDAWPDAEVRNHVAEPHAGSFG